jgi:hypothetical protein
MSGPAPLAGHLRALAWFTVAQGTLVALVGVLLARLFPLAGDARALRAAAFTAVVLQTFTFLVARIVGRDQIIAGWGLGVLLRMGAVALWALLLVPALGLAATPALIGLVAFLFATTLVEPLFLSR